MHAASPPDPRIPRLDEIEEAMRRAFKGLPRGEVARAMAKTRCPDDDGLVYLSFEFGEHQIGSHFDPCKLTLDQHIQEAAPRLQRTLRKQRLLNDAEHGDYNQHAGLLRRLRAAVNKKGRDAKPRVIIKAVGVSNQRGREGLRELEAAGEYDGFARKKPGRYQ